MTDERAPLPLFHIDRGQTPPPGSVEIYLDTPDTVGVLRSAVLQLGGEYAGIANAVEEACMAALQPAMSFFHRHAGYVQQGGAGSPPTPGQMLISTVTEWYADQHTDVSRIHHHVFFGPYGYGDDGNLWPIDMARAHQASTPAHRVFNEQLQRVLRTAMPKLEWAPGPRGIDEISNPPPLDIPGGYEHLLCFGPVRADKRWYPHQMVLDQPRAM